MESMVHESEHRREFCRQFGLGSSTLNDYQYLQISESLVVEFGTYSLPHLGLEPEDCNSYSRSSKCMKQATQYKLQ